MTREEIKKSMHDTKKEIVIKNLHKLLLLVEGQPEYEDCISYAIEKLEQEPRWIPVSERLPKAGEYIGNVERYYLVQNEYGDMLVASYPRSGCWEQIYQLNPIGDEIVAWMPLPTPYESQESEDKE